MVATKETFDIIKKFVEANNFYKNEAFSVQVELNTVECKDGRIMFDLKFYPSILETSLEAVQNCCAYCERIEREVENIWDKRMNWRYSF